MMYEYWLGKIRGLSGTKKRKLREYYGDARNIYYIEENEKGRKCKWMGRD